MSRKPVVGGDKGHWGEVLNDFLRVSHTESGEHKIRTWANDKARPSSPEEGESGVNLEKGVLERFSRGEWQTIIGGYSHGSSGIFRGVGEKLSEIVSIKDYGAKGDGRTDDSQALRRALAASPVVFIPEANTHYLIESTVAIPANAKIYGQHKYGKSFLKGALGVPVLSITKSSGVTLENIRIEGNRAACVKITDSPKWSISSCDIGSGNLHLGKCIEVLNSPYGLIEKSEIGNSGNGGFAISCLDGCDGLNIRKNVISGGSGSGAILVGKARSVNITGSIIETSKYGIWIASSDERADGPCYAVNITGNYLERCDEYLKIGATHKVTSAIIRGNYMGNSHQSRGGLSMIHLGDLRSSEISYNALSLNGTNNHFFYQFYSPELNSVRMEGNQYTPGRSAGGMYSLDGTWSQNDKVKLGAGNVFDFSSEKGRVSEYLSPYFDLSKNSGDLLIFPSDIFELGGRILSIEIFDADITVGGATLRIGGGSVWNCEHRIAGPGSNSGYNYGYKNISITSSFVPAELKIAISPSSRSSGNIRVRVRYQGN